MSEIKSALDRAREVLRTEARALTELISHIDRDFEQAVDAIMTTTGRVVVTGMGKPGFIAQKLSATLSSTGTPSLFLHPAEAIHGDLGRVTSADVVCALSNSGETDEIVRLLPVIKMIGAQLISMTGARESTLAKASDIVLDIGLTEEACPLGLAPTTSTTAMLAMGDALAMSVAEGRGFKAEDFALFHPGGILGKKLLLRVEDIMRTGESNPIVGEDCLVKEVLLAITEARAGSCTVVDADGKVSGIFTDGDLRRHLEHEGDISAVPIKNVMCANPHTIAKDKLAAEGLRMLKEYRIDEVPVVDINGRPLGLLDVQDILKAGLL